jgi:sulfide:quinone oxidoreductase
MAKFVILGGGVAGHTAAGFAAKWLGKDHEVVVVTPNAKWNWIPSNIWVGVGEMSKEDVTFSLAPVYKKAGITYKQAKGLSINPEGDIKTKRKKSFVSIEHTSKNKLGKKENITYDYLLNATGPKLNFGATKGLGVGSELGKHTVSVCSAEHAIEANKELEKCIAKMKKGEKQKFLIGTGHGLCTCQGAAFEYIFNVEHRLKEEGVREMAEIKWISNEAFLGDFGMGGVHMKVGGFTVSSNLFAESVFAERNVDWIIGAHVEKVAKNKVFYELLDGSKGEETFDFAMLIPPFAGVGLNAFNKNGKNITSKLFASNNFLKVDAKYDVGDYKNWKASDWPKTYQNPTYKNIFAAGIAFAPPHPISEPRFSPNKTPIYPTPPRTGMPAATIGKIVARSVADLILKGEEKTTLQTASMASMGAACVASTGKGIFNGSAASMSVYPIVPDFEKYPETGRDLKLTFGEVGLAGHWLKQILHYLFLYKAKMKMGWGFIPE